MKPELPDTMQAIQQDEANGRLILRELPVPRPGPGEVLVRMTAAPINPSDLGALSGLNYSGQRSYPFIPGLEGSGTVTDVGSGILSRMLMGKRVSCLASFDGYGTWAEYMLTSAQLCIPLKRGVNLEHAAMLVVNPLTALAMIDIARKGKHRAIVNTVAASNLGGMILRRAHHQGIPVINIVRRSDQEDVVRDRGGEFILNSSEPDFDTRLQELAQQLNATLLLDAVGGEMTQRLAAAAPKRSTILLYSKMADQDCIVDPFMALVKDLRLQGWFLSNWLNDRSLLQNLSLFRQAQKLLETDLYSPVGRRITLDQAQVALEAYMESMTNHKTLFTINDVDS